MQTYVSYSASRAVTLTKSDTNTISAQFLVSNSGVPAPGFARRLYVGGAGDVTVTTMGGDLVTFKAVPVGSFLDVECTLLMSTNTTATLVVALYW